MNKRIAALSLLAGAMGATCLPAEACSVTLASSGKTYTSVTSAVAAAQVVDSIAINGSGGTCTENVSVPNTLLHLNITGTNGAAITGASSTAPVLDLRAKGVYLDKLTITGGLIGVFLHRNANGYLNALTVQNAAGNGIAVAEMAYAVILNSTVQNNGGNGIAAYQNGAVRIGVDQWETEATTTYSANTIKGNGGNGISVGGNSASDIFKNTIQSNGLNGIYVFGAAGMSMGGNNISANTGSALYMLGNTAVAMGVEVTNHSVALPDSTTSNNGAYGVVCAGGTALGGFWSGTNPLDGTSGYFYTDTTCLNGTTVP